MPVWLQIIIAVVGAVGTICGILGISAYVQERQKHKAQRKNKSEDDEEARKVEEQKELEKIRHDAYIEELKSVIGEAVSPLSCKLDAIEDDLCLVKNGLQKDLYVDLTHIYNEYKAKGYATLAEKRDYDSLYWAYHNLGKNGVADSMHEYVMGMDEEKRKSKATTTKRKGSQTLVEGK